MQKQSQTTYLKMENSGEYKSIVPEGTLSLVIDITWENGQVFNIGIYDVDLDLESIFFQKQTL